MRSLEVYMLSYKKICLGGFFANTYVVWDEDTKEAMVIDAGNDSAAVHKFTEENGLSVRYIVLTHAHFDHIMYIDEYRALFSDAKSAIGAADDKLLSDVEGNVSSLFGRSRTFKGVDVKLCDGEKITLGESSLTVIATPGHTPGGICLYSEADKLMFTGDTLFAGGGIGRTDFKYGSIELLRSSLKRILSMDGEITILPGHSGESQIKYEQRSLFY